MHAKTSYTNFHAAKFTILLQVFLRFEGCAPPLSLDTATDREWCNILTLTLETLTIFIVSAFYLIRRRGRSPEKSVRKRAVDKLISFVVSHVESNLLKYKPTTAAIVTCQPSNMVVSFLKHKTTAEEAMMFTALATRQR